MFGVLYYFTICLHLHFFENQQLILPLTFNFKLFFGVNTNNYHVLVVSCLP